MLSMPPDTTISAEPALMISCASIVAFMPEPQTLLMVVAPVASGSLAPRAACRAGAWPCPAGSTQPMNTSSTRSGANLARSSAAPITWEPSLCALKDERSPINRPSGVRAAETMTTGSEAAALAGAPQFLRSSARPLLNDIHHMTRRGICNGGAGINCCQVAGRLWPVEGEQPQQSSSAKADDPVSAAVSISNERHGVLDAPHARGMTALVATASD